MADHFGGVDLIVLPGGIQDDGPVVYSMEVVPGSTDVFIDIAGPQAQHIVLPIWASTFTGLDSLRALKGTTAALVYGTGAPGGPVSITSALLIDVKPTQTNPLGEQQATGEFLVVTP